MLGDAGTLAVELVVFGTGELLLGFGAIHAAAEGCAGEAKPLAGADEGTLGKHCGGCGGRAIEWRLSQFQWRSWEYGRRADEDGMGRRLSLTKASVGQGQGQSCACCCIRSGEASQGLACLGCLPSSSSRLPPGAPRDAPKRNVTSLVTCTKLERRNQTNVDVTGQEKQLNTSFSGALDGMHSEHNCYNKRTKEAGTSPFIIIVGRVSLTPLTPSERSRLSPPCCTLAGSFV